MTQFYFIRNLYYLLLPLLLLLSTPTSSRSSSAPAGPLLWIEAPQKGPYPVNSTVVFSCIHKLKDRYEKLTWQFILLSDNLSTIPAQIDSSFEDTSIGFNRTSRIRIPEVEVSAISCLWSNLNGSETNASLSINVSGLSTRPRVSKRQAEKPECPKGPHIFFYKTSSNSCLNNHDNSNAGESSSISVNVSSSDRLFLTCVYFANESNTSSSSIEPQWSLVIPERTPIKPTRTVVLNYLALINWKRSQMTRCKRNLHAANESRWNTNAFMNLDCPISGYSSPVELFFAPETSSVSSVFKCSMDETGEESHITVITEPEMERKQIPNEHHHSQDKDDNREFLELINALMQILQASESASGGGGAGGNGGIYGVGFGSSTIIVLMAIAIYYLKRQIKQLQEQVELGERRRRKSRPSRAQTDEDDETDDL